LVWIVDIAPEEDEAPRLRIAKEIPLLIGESKARKSGDESALCHVPDLSPGGQKGQ
jgi:hypothetical protein